MKSLIVLALGLVIMNSSFASEKQLSGETVMSFVSEQDNSACKFQGSKLKKIVKREMLAKMKRSCVSGEVENVMEMLTIEDLGTSGSECPWGYIAVTGRVQANCK